MSLKSNRKTTTMRIHPSLQAVWGRVMRPRGVTTIAFTRALAELVSRLSPADQEVLCPTPPSSQTTPQSPLTGSAGRRRLGRSRKGVMDSLTTLFVVFIAALFCVVALWLAVQFKDVFTTWGTEVPAMSEGISTANDAMDRLPGIINILVGLGFFALSAITIGLAYLTPSHPMLVIIVLPVLLLGVYFGAHLSNSWDTMTQDADEGLGTAVSDASFLDLLMTYLVEAWLGMAFIAAIAFYVGLKHRQVAPGSFTGGGFS